MKNFIKRKTKPSFDPYLQFKMKDFLSKSIKNCTINTNFKMSEYSIPAEPSYFWAWVLIPVLLGTSLIPLLLAPGLTTLTKSAYTVARGSLTRFAAVEFCQQHNMSLPLPTNANDTVSKMR